MTRKAAPTSLAVAAALLAGCAGNSEPLGPIRADPAVEALLVCVARAPGDVCARPTVETDSGRVVAGPDYWSTLRDRDAFGAAVEACGRAGASGDAVGSVAGITGARRRFARERLDGRAPEGAEFDPGICHDVYLAFALGESGGEAAVTGGLTAAEVAFVAAQARAVRDRAEIEAMGGRGYGASSVGSSSDESSNDAP